MSFGEFSACAAINIARFILFTPMRVTLKQLVLGSVGFALCSAAWAETWPPLRPPDPLPLEWVAKQVFVRFPEVHAKHRAYLAALERVPRGGDSDLRVQIGRHDAERLRLQAIEHHLMLQWQATHAFYDYALAVEHISLLENYKRLVDAYVPAVSGRMTRNATARRDLALEAARLHANLLKLKQDRSEATLRLNTLMEHRLDALLPPPKLGATGPLPADRDDLIGRALKNGIPMRMAEVDTKRSGAVMELAGSKRAPEPAIVGLTLFDRDAKAATHEVARAQDQRRATGAKAVASVIAIHGAARAKHDMLTLYEQDILPRAEQLLRTALAEYQGNRGDIFELLDAYRARYDIEVEALQIRIDYEKTLADLTRETGALPPYMERKMSLKPLNVGEDK